MPEIPGGLARTSDGNDPLVGDGISVGSSGSWELSGGAADTTGAVGEGGSRSGSRSGRGSVREEVNR